MLKKGAARFARRAFFVGVGPSNFAFVCRGTGESWYSCSLVEPTPVYPGGRRGNNSRPHAKIATTSAWQGAVRFEKRKRVGAAALGF